jgi:hypothetical protein
MQADDATRAIVTVPLYVRRGAPFFVGAAQQQIRQIDCIHVIG